MEKSLDYWVRPSLRALSAYPVPDSSGFIKLDAMENPYRWSDEMLDAWLARLRDAPLNRYPDPGATRLKALLRETMAIPAASELALGNGSDELIQMLALLLSGPGRKILAPEPGFVMYKMIGLFTNMDYVGVPLRGEDFALDEAAMLEAIEVHQPALIFLAYPNNPTGNLFNRTSVERIIRAAPGLVVVDEAYCAFADDSFMGDLPRYPNLLVMRTVSKIGLAGLRLGLLAGAPEWIAEIDKVRLPYNINVLTQHSAEFALQHYAVLLAQTEQIKQDRALLAAALVKLPGTRVWPSEANFILLRVADALGVFNALLERKILIKKLHGSHPLLEQCLRITVGTPEQNQQLLDALQETIN